MPTEVGDGVWANCGTRHHSRGGEAKSEAWDSWSWFGGPQACKEAWAVWFSGITGNHGRAKNGMRALRLDLTWGQWRGEGLGKWGSSGWSWGGGGSSWFDGCNWLELDGDHDWECREATV